MRLAEAAFRFGGSSGRCAQHTIAAGSPGGAWMTGTPGYRDRGL